MKKIVLLALVGIVATSCNMEEGRKNGHQNNSQEHAEKKEGDVKAAQPEQPEDAVEKIEEAAPNS